MHSSPTVDRDRVLDMTAQIRGADVSEVRGFTGPAYDRAETYPATGENEAAAGVRLATAGWFS